MPYPQPSLTWVTEPDMSAEAALALAIPLAAIGVRTAFRLPHEHDSAFAHMVREATNASLAPLIHNRPHLWVPGTGVWLPFAARGIIAEVDWSEKPHVAMSVHSEAEADVALRLGADELIFGHVFPTESHPGEPGRGLGALAALIDHCSRHAPGTIVTAIGGITPGNAANVGSTGCRNIAAIRAISKARDPVVAARSMLDALASTLQD